MVAMTMYYFPVSPNRTFITSCQWIKNGSDKTVVFTSEKLIDTTNQDLVNYFDCLDLRE
jgi:hypothetical protein